MEKQRIVTAHNKVRQMVATGQIKGQPAATNMRQDKSLIIGIDPVSLPKLRTPNRGLLRDYEPSDGPSFQALLFYAQGAGVGRGAGRGGAEVG